MSRVSRSTLGLTGGRACQPSLVGEDDGLDSVPELQLGEDAGHVGLDRRRAERQLRDQFGVAQPAGQQPQYLEFSRCQVGQAGGIDLISSGRR